MDLEKQLKDINAQIRSLDTQRGHLLERYKIESYKEKMGIIGKSYKHENTYYKVIDLNIDNKYRCFCLTFTKKDFDIVYVQESLSRFGDMLTFTNGILESIGIGMENVMIENLVNNAEEISSEDFDKEYFNKCEKILKLDKLLLKKD